MPIPKGTDLSLHSATDLAAVALALNTRRRKTLGWRTPAEALDEVWQLQRKRMDLVESLNGKLAGWANYRRNRRQGHLQKKIGVAFRNYRILGACNPALAYEALQLEDKVGTMLPYNVVVQEVAANKVEGAAIDSVASMQAIDNPRLLEAAARVQAMLRNVVENL